MECKNIYNAEKIQRSMTQYVFNCAEVDYKECLLMTNFLSLTVLFAFESAYGARKMLMLMILLVFSLMVDAHFYFKY